MAVIGRKRRALFLFAGCISLFIFIWAFLPGLSVLQWLGHILLAVGAINLGYWLFLARLVPKG